MIPLIENEVIRRRKWLPEEDFTDLLTLAQSVPGPIAVNTAVFVGYRRAGLKGALAAAAGVVVPSFTVILAIALWFSSVRSNTTVEAAFRGMRPAVAALIAGPVWAFTRGMGWFRIILTAIAAALIWLGWASPVALLAAGAVGGILYSFWKK